MDGDGRATVLLVCGSLQRRSANRAVLDVLAGSLGEAAVEWFRRLGEVPAFDPDLTEQGSEPVDAWRRAVAAADVVVLAVPEYAGGMAGALKNALDWLVGTGELYRKPLVLLSAGTTGGGNARQQAAQTVTWQGAYVVAEMGIAAPRTKFTDDGRLHDATTAGAIEEIVAMVRAAPAMLPAELVGRATDVVGRLGVDAVHVAPA